MERCTQVSTTKQLVFLLVVTLAGVLVILCNNTNIASPRMSYSKLVVEDKANSTKLETGKFSPYYRYHIKLYSNNIIYVWNRLVF